MRESVESFLKPKSKKEIAMNITSEILLGVLNGQAITFFSSNKGTYALFEAGKNIDEFFDKIHKQYGPGLYVYTSQGNKIIPLENVFKSTHIHTSASGNLAVTAYKFDIPKPQIDLALNELVINALEGNLGDGFHIKYFDVINESVFEPKSKEAIYDDLTDKIMASYDKEIIGVGLNYAWKPEIVRNSGYSYYDKAYSQYGKGLYLGVNDDGIDKAEQIIKQICQDYHGYATNNPVKSANKIGYSHFLIKTSIDNEKHIIKQLCKSMLEEEYDKYRKHGIDFFNVRKFIK